MKPPIRPFGPGWLQEFGKAPTRQTLHMLYASASVPVTGRMPESTRTSEHVGFTMPYPTMSTVSMEPRLVGTCLTLSCTGGTQGASPHTNTTLRTAFAMP